MPLIIGAKPTAAGAYTVDNSCRFNFGDSPKLSRAVSTGTANTKFTFSCWFKTSTVNSSYGRILWGGVDSGNETGITLYALSHATKKGIVDIYLYGSSSIRDWQTTALHRDPSAWYHLVVRVDTTDATAGDRIQAWINGTRVTSWGASSNPDENETFDFFHSNNITIGREQDSGDRFSYDGYLAEVCAIDGTAYTASDFGEFDEDSPTIWVPKDISGLTFGTSGFYLNFEDSADLGADASGNSNDFTATNIDATDQATDTPANNFATGNPLSNPRVVSSTVYLPTYSNGNNTINHANASYYTGDRNSIGVMSGKWYVEAECSAVGDELFIGLTSEENHSEIDTTYLYEDDGTFGGSAYGSAYVSGDIIQIAFDATNGTVWFGLNGTWQNSATAEEIQNGTTTNAAASGLTMTKFWHIASKGYNGATWNFNFGGCPAFTVSSGNADGDGYGNFEYAPPSGYYALCTKNLAEYG